MTFRKAYEAHTSECSCAGNTKKPVFTLVNKNGERSLKMVDEIDIPASINSHVGETDLKAMLKRYSLTGDATVLRKGGGDLVYEDVSSCETNYARLIQSTRELAILQLQFAQNSEKMSENGKENEDLMPAASSDPVSPVSKNDNVEVTNE